MGSQPNRSLLLVPRRRNRSTPVPLYARGNVEAMNADAIVVFRGLNIGVFHDWFVTLLRPYCTA